MMNPDPSTSGDSLTGEVRLRLPLPIVIPFGALIVIGLIAFGFSRILLSVPKEIALIVAGVTAANVLAGCAVIALRKNMNRSVMAELAIVVLYPVLIGGVIAALNIETEEHGGEAVTHAETETGETGGAGGSSVSAENVAFSTDEIQLTAGEENTITFSNDDTAPHNIAIYETQAADKDIFVGEVIDGGEEIDYTFQAPNKPGEAYFQCDVHPGMNGTVTIE